MGGFSPKDQSLRGEPHFEEPPRGESDPSESKAERVLDREASRPDVTGHEFAQSVSEEVHTTRGLHPNPSASWAAWYDTRRAFVSPAVSWAILMGAALLSGPFAVMGALWNSHGDLSLVLLAPTVEEVLKVGLIAMLIETRPYLVRSALQIRLVAFSGALGFAAIENVLYLKVYIDDPSPSIVLWRWTVCTALHVTCTLIASEGLARVWRRTYREHVRPSLDGVYKWLFAAIALHAAYNTSVLIAGFAGHSF